MSFFQGASDARINNSTFININNLPNNSTVVWDQRSPQPSHPTMTSPGTRTDQRRHPNPSRTATTSEEPGASRGANEPGLDYAAGVSNRGVPTMFNNCKIGNMAGGTFNKYTGDATINVTSVCHQPPRQHGGRTTVIADIEMGRDGTIKRIYDRGRNEIRHGEILVDGRRIPRGVDPLNAFRAAAGGHRDGEGQQPQTGPRDGPRHAPVVFPPGFPFHNVPRPSAQPPAPPDSASSHSGRQRSGYFANSRIGNVHRDRVKVNGLTIDEAFAGANVDNWVREPGSFGGDERGSERGDYGWRSAHSDGGWSGDDGWRSERGDDEEMLPEESGEVESLGEADGVDTAEPGSNDPSVQPGPRITPPRK